MLARINRLVRGDDYKRVVRRGVKASGRHTITYMVAGSGSPVVRFGFITAASIGGSVIRNRVRRRLKAVCRGMLDEVQPGADIVIRALPSSPEASSASLEADLRRALVRGRLMEAGRPS